MRAELQVRNGPWVWFAFVVFCMVYAAGFSNGHDASPVSPLAVEDVGITGARLLTAHLVALGLGYLVLFAEPKDPVALRRLLSRLADGQVRSALESVPRWAVVLVPLAVTASMVLMLASSGAALVLSTGAFFLRDAGLVLLLNLGARPRRSDAAALLYLVVLYGLLPALLDAAVGVDPAGWLLPAVDGNAVLVTLPALLQALAVWAAVGVRWRRIATG